HRPGQRPREPHPVRDAGQQRTPSIPHQTRTVRRHSQLLNQPITLHHLGDPPEVAMRVSATRTLPAQSDVSAPRPARGAALNARSRSESRVRENRTHGSTRRRQATTASRLVRAVPGSLPPTLPSSGHELGALDERFVAIGLVRSGSAQIAKAIADKMLPFPRKAGKSTGRARCVSRRRSGARRLLSTGGGQFATALSGASSRRSRCQNRAQRATYDAISVRGSSSQMSRSPMRTQRNTYTAYSIGCAGVWGVILLLARRRLDSQTWNTLRLVCSGWWM